MCELIAASLFPHKVHATVSSMPCIPINSECVPTCQEHNHKDDSNTPIGFVFDIDYEELETLVKENKVPASVAETVALLDLAASGASQVPAAVTRLLSRSEMFANKNALQAVRKEADGLEDAKTWLLGSAREKEDVIKESKHTGVSIHLGQLMSICSEKFSEMAEHLRVLKGRIVYRGDIGRDENGAAAIYQDMAASPTSVQGLNACLAYGSIRGHKVTAADAIKAYVQSTLKSKHVTWIELPPELRPTSWQGKFRRPVVILNKALYGHPEAGAHWERHLEDVVVKQGKAIKLSPEFPSNYFFPDSKLLLTVYVDDLTLAGPEGKHDEFWKWLQDKVDIEPPEPASRILGRYHDISTSVDGSQVSFNMEDYSQQCCDLYLSIEGSKPLKRVPTPFVPDGSLTVEDDEIKGALAPNAAKMLMKCLWLARLSRPDLLKPINDLASCIQNWSINCDRQLYRLVCYIHSTPELRLKEYVKDPAKDLKLRLYADADFAGCRLTARSTSGYT